MFMLASLARLSQAVVVGAGHRLRPVTAAGFRVYVVDVGFDGRFADDEQGGDLVVRLA